MQQIITRLSILILVSWGSSLLPNAYTPDAIGAFIPVYRGGICVADGAGNCVGGDIRAESGLGSQVGYMKTTADPGTVPVYQSTCYSDGAGSCTAWGLSLDVNGSPVGYLSTTAPDSASANAPLVQSNGLLLQNLGGTPYAYVWTVIPPAIANLSPTSGPVGTSVTITGTNFGASQGTSTVTFNGVTATPSSWSATSISAPVPSGAATGPVVITVAGSASNGVNFTVTTGGGGGSATRLVVTSVNGGSNPTAGAGFPVIVQAHDNSGVLTNVSANTGVSLSLKTGTGTLGGTVTGTISAGTNQVTINGVTYAKAESGVVITATRTSGDDLTAGDSAGFLVNPGAATKLAFTVQPGNSTAGSTLAGPPTVSVQDAFSNTVTSSTASITVAIGSNPGGGSLSGTTTRNASFGVAAFTGLSINQAANGYTLSATSAGLTSATSIAFNITTTGGTIAGAITRVSNGTVISGALVEAIQGTSVVASTTTNASGNYSISGLSNGTYTVRGSFTGYVPQVRTGVAITGGSSTTVDLALNVGIAIHGPVSGTAINDYSVLVTGLFDTSLGEVGINVNGYVALQDGDEFATLVPVEQTTSSLTATVTNTSGTALASHTIPVTVQAPASEPIINFRPSPAVTFVTEPVSFVLTSLNPISQIQLDANGDGTIDYTGMTLDGVSFTFAEPGLYVPSVAVIELDETVRSATALIQVLNMGQLDSVLTTKWNAMKNALRNGNTAAAADYIVKSKRATYQNVFNNLTISFANIDQILGNISYAGQRGTNVEYEMIRIENSESISYMVMFSLDEDGVWRIKFF
jgi:Carboxypeptidase regulatory-like domain/IPT/TIG domain